MALQANALLTLAEAKAALAITGASQDPILEGLINGVSDEIETLLGRRLIAATYTGVRLDGNGQCLLISPEWPITAVASCSLADVAQTIWMPGDSDAPEDHDVLVRDGADPKHSRWGIYRWAGWPLGMSNVKLTYTAGYGAVGFALPGDLKEAAAELLRERYHRQTRQEQGVSSRSVMGESVTFMPVSLGPGFWRTIAAYRRWAF